MGKRLATPEQATEVRRRARAGEPLRAIAAAVFGSARLKGRCERILRTSVRAEAGAVRPPQLDPPALAAAELELHRALVDVALAFGLEPPAAPS